MTTVPPAVLELGSDPLAYIAERMQIDAEWAVETANSITWWAGRLAQRLTLEAPRDVHGVQVVTLHIETDLLKDVPVTSTTWEQLAGLNRLASLSAYVADTGAAAIRLHASVSLTKDNLPMAQLLALHAVALQVADAHAEARELARVFGAAVDESEHPRGGRRMRADEMLGVADIYQQRGQDPSPFTFEEIAGLVRIDPRPWLMASSEPSRLVADLAFAEGRPARLELDATARHPALGSGVQLRLALPVEPDAAIAQRLNASETGLPDAHQLGAWSVDPERGLLFGAFIPAGAYVPELLRALVYHAAGRNEWAREILFPTSGDLVS